MHIHALIYICFPLCLTSLCMTDSKVHPHLYSPISFLLVAKLYSIVYMHYILFIRSSVSGHSGYLCVLAIVNSVTTNTGTCASLCCDFLKVHQISSWLSCPWKGNDISKSLLLRQKMQHMTQVMHPWGDFICSNSFHL